VTVSLPGHTNDVHWSIISLQQATPDIFVKNESLPVVSQKKIYERSTDSGQGYFSGTKCVTQTQKSFFIRIARIVGFQKHIISMDDVKLSLLRLCKKQCCLKYFQKVFQLQNTV